MGPGAWLEVIAGLASALRVPHRIVAAGSRVRRPAEERITFLAAARNAALSPLWDMGSAAPSATAERRGTPMKVHTTPSYLPSTNSSPTKLGYFHAPWSK